jgi:hypothetical protein
MSVVSKILAAATKTAPWVMALVVVLMLALVM